MNRYISKKDLTFICFDYYSRAVYKDSKGRIFKDISLTGNDKYIPNLLYKSADNTFEGEPYNEYHTID